MLSYANLQFQSDETSREDVVLPAINLPKRSRGKILNIGFENEGLFSIHYITFKANLLENREPT